MLHVQDGTLLSADFKVKMKTQQACLSTVSGEEIKLSRSWFSGKCVTLTVGGVMSAGPRMFCANPLALVHTFPQSQRSQGTLLTRHEDRSYSVIYGWQTLRLPGLFSAGVLKALEMLSIGCGRKAAVGHPAPLMAHASPHKAPHVALKQRCGHAASEGP